MALGAPRLCFLPRHRVGGRAIGQAPGGVKEAVMHSRHRDDETRPVSRLTILAAALFLVLLAGVAIKFDLWQTGEDNSAAILLQDKTPQPVTTAQRPN